MHLRKFILGIAITLIITPLWGSESLPLINVEEEVKTLHRLFAQERDHPMMERSYEEEGRLYLCSDRGDNGHDLTKVLLSFEKDASLSVRKMYTYMKLTLTPHENVDTRLDLLSMATEKEAKLYIRSHPKEPFSEGWILYELVTPGSQIGKEETVVDEGGFVLVGRTESPSRYFFAMLYCQLLDEGDEESSEEESSYESDSEESDSEGSNRGDLPPLLPADHEQAEQVEEPNVVQPVARISVVGTLVSGIGGYMVGLWHWIASVVQDALWVVRSW